ncbi:MAG TPA: hypothetical protein VHM90_15070, partial [Phycisphaerae bacterium]|nr:hypothetical protein [Phycisphaerae bacterium]
MRNRSFLRRISIVAAALLTASILATARAAVPDVLKVVPADAYGVIVINNARTLATKVAAAGARLQAPIPPDLLGAATRAMGIDEGFDVNSSVALVLLKPDADHEGVNYFNFKELPPAIVIMAATDPKAMLNNFKPADPDKDGISQVTLPQADEKGYVTIVDKKWVVLAQKRDDLVSYIARKDNFAAKASPETLKVFDANDLVLWANVEKMGKGVDKLLDDQLAANTGMIELQQLNKQGDASAQALEKQTMKLGVNFAKQFFSDANAGMITARITDSGATLGLVGDFKPDSAFGKFIAAQTGRGPISLKGLPASSTGGGFLMAGAARWNSTALSNVIGTVIDQLLSDPAIKGAKADELRKSMDVVKQMMNITQGMSMVILDPPAGNKDGMFNGAALVETSDPKKFIDLQMQSMKNPAAQEAISPDIKTTMTPAEPVNIKGVALTRVTVNFALRDATPENPITPENQMAAEVIQRMYGKNGMTVSFGTVGNRVIVIYGTDPAITESAITAAQSDTDALSANPAITAVKDEVVANPVGVFYLPMARWITFGAGLVFPTADAGGPPDPAIAAAPPMVMSTGIDGKMLTAEIHVPIASITAVQEAIKKIEKAMGGGTP